MGEGYIRRTPLPDFPSKSHGQDHPHSYNARTRPVKGGRRPVSALGSINTLPGTKWALNRSKTGLLGIGLHKGWWSLDSPGTTSCG